MWSPNYDRWVETDPIPAALGVAERTQQLNREALERGRTWLQEVQHTALRMDITFRYTEERLLGLAMREVNSPWVAPRKTVQGRNGQLFTEVAYHIAGRPGVITSAMESHLRYIARLLDETMYYARELYTTNEEVHSLIGTMPTSETEFADYNPGFRPLLPWVRWDYHWVAQNGELQLKILDVNSMPGELMPAYEIAEIFRLDFDIALFLETIFTCYDQWFRKFSGETRAAPRIALVTRERAGFLPEFFILERLLKSHPRGGYTFIGYNDQVEHRGGRLFVADREADLVIRSVRAPAMFYHTPQEAQGARNLIQASTAGHVCCIPQWQRLWEDHIWPFVFAKFKTFFAGKLGEERYGQLLKCFPRTALVVEERVLFPDETSIPWEKVRKKRIVLKWPDSSSSREVIVLGRKAARSEQKVASELVALAKKAGRILVCSEYIRPSRTLLPVLDKSGEISLRPLNVLYNALISRGHYLGGVVQASPYPKIHGGSGTYYYPLEVI